LANAPTNFTLVLRSRRLVPRLLLFEFPFRPARLCPANFLLYRTGRFRISDLTQDSFKRFLHAARFESVKDAWQDHSGGRCDLRQLSVNKYEKAEDGACEGRDLSGLKQ
jgi:hypothetical protein